jgi:hypothetical protein
LDGSTPEIEHCRFRNRVAIIEWQWIAAMHDIVRADVRFILNVVKG